MNAEKFFTVLVITCLLYAIACVAHNVVYKNKFLALCNEKGGSLVEAKNNSIYPKYVCVKGI